MQRVTGKRRIIALLLALSGLVLLAGCLGAAPSSPGAPTATGGTVTPADSHDLPARGFFMGVLPVPRDGQSFEDCYRQAADNAEFVPVWGRPTPFYGLADELNGSWGRVFVEQYTRGSGMFPLVHLSFIDAGITLKAPPGLAGATLSDASWREVYKQAALDVVRAARPLYLSLGNEVNRWYEKHGDDSGNPDGFQHFVSLYNELYDAVKQVSPDTRVFCTFAREIISENREADLDVLRMFDAERLDLLVFTSYPYAVRYIDQPGDIPDDYYARALSYLPGKAL
ncbi:MAG: hypothetical protein IBX68_03390, partial [Dehalococcoidia bacterium]|nr:hypothetical protein [Dehalococcoidia bacterium]